VVHSSLVLRRQLELLYHELRDSMTIVVQRSGCGLDMNEQARRKKLSANYDINPEL